MIPCPACPAQLQVLEATSSYAQKGWDHARAHGVELPQHGPSALRFLALVAHAQVVHPDIDLAGYLEAYLDS